MFSTFSIFCMTAMILKSAGNPIVAGDNETDVENLKVQMPFECEEKSNLTGNFSLFELLNNDRLWYISIRSNFVFGDQTWNNVLMQTWTDVNDTVYLQFIGENSNGSCVNSEKGHIISNNHSNRVVVYWPNQQGFIEIIYSDEKMTHLRLCYSVDSNASDICMPNQNEHFVIEHDENESKNETLPWLKSHCASLNVDDFIVKNNPRKCVPVVSNGEIIDRNTTEQSTRNESQTIVEMTTNVEQETVTMAHTEEIGFTTSADQTGRLETFEEYKDNVTLNSTFDNEENLTAYAIENKKIVVLSENVSSVDESNETNINSTNETVIETFNNETNDANLPVFKLHNAAILEATTQVSAEDVETTQDSFTVFQENKSSIKYDVDVVTKQMDSESTSVASTVEKQIVNLLTVEETTKYYSTVLIVKESETTTTTTTAVTTTTTATIATTGVETTVELTTVETTRSTNFVPVDCPAFRDCPFDYCAFARKLDNRGCPTCNCLQSNTSNIVCPTLTCQSCLYGHFTDPNGCPTCQCQSRPFPPLGERCPQLNCEPCYFGTVKDEYNCDTCVCIQPNIRECPLLNCTFGPCKYGSAEDEDNCPTCDCLLPTNISAAEMNCSATNPCLPCHLGYVKDASGCETCQCKSRGHVQCEPMSAKCYCEHGAYLNSDGCETCTCLPDPKNASRQACWELSNDANFHNTSGPTCASDGSFHARQCDKAQSKCWCVTSIGIHIQGFESKPEENANCACATELYQVSSLRMIGHHLLCSSNGNYAPIQCDDRYCSCVDEYGKPIGPSVSVQNREQLRCVGVYQQLHPERFLLHQATIDQPESSRSSYDLSSSSLCLKHLEQIRNANITDDHMLIPQCDANGLYASVQCDQNERYCWCVDKKTGVEMDGTRRLNARPNCNVD